MKKQYLAVAIASAIAVTACKPADQQNLGSTDATVGSQQQEMAQVAFGVKFPEGPNAAFIDVETQSLHVVVSKVELGTVEEAIALTEQECEYYDEYWDDEKGEWVYGCSDDREGQLLGYPVADLWLTPSDNTGSVQLFPGKYRIAVEQYDADPESTTTEPKLIGRSVSYTTLTNGSHNVSLNLLRGTWDVVNGPQSLQLLNTAVIDDSNAEVDLDPTTTEVESVPATLMGLDASVGIDGLHLLGMEEAQALFDSTDDGTTEEPTTASDGEYDDHEDHLRGLLGGMYAPLLRQGDQVVLPDGYESSVYDDTTGIDAGIRAGMDMPAMLLQQYTPEESNKHWLTLGAWNLNSWEWNEQGENGIEAGLMFFTDLMDEGPNLDEAVLNETTGMLEVNDSETEQHNVYEESYLAADGSEQFYYVADFSVENETETFPQEVETLLTPSQINSNGNIDATLVEYVGQWSGDQTAAVPDPQDGPSPTTASEGDSQQGSLQQAVVRELQLQQAAAQLGLTAQAAAEGDNCVTVTGTGSGYWSQYMWDGTQWVPGTRNYSYNVVDNGDGTFTLEGDDLNGDGEVMPFETGVYENWTCEWDDNLQQDVCDDLDSDGTGEQYEEASLDSWNHTSEIQACAYQVTLTPSNLSFDITSLMSDTGVTVSSEQ